MNSALRVVLRCMAAVMLATSWTSLTSVALSAADLPNVVIVFADDLGYADLSCFGGKIHTPYLDHMASEGRKLTSFYVAQAVCSASRTALLTGCYPNRVDILGALGPQSKNGIHDDETTIAEVLKTRGYATAIFGKWHLGHWPQFLPTRHGFDHYFGLPYSNDMWPQHPTAKFPDLPLIERDRVIAVNPDQSQLVKWYAERAVQFIEASKDRPFFLYVPHAMPHVPLFVSDRYAGRSGHGLYGDVIQEIDWSVGQILAALKRCEIDDRTLVIFTSDNGPWLSYGHHAGSAGPLREGKGTAWDGGVRVPFIARWPGKIPAGTETNAMAATIDILPTVAKLAGASLPAKPIDGVDVSPVLLSPTPVVSPRENYFFFWGQELHAVRSGPWKLHFEHPYITVPEPGRDGRPGKVASTKTTQALYNLEHDVGEQHDLADKHPEVVQRLNELAEQARADLGDTLTKRKGAHARPAGQLVP